MMNKKHLAVLLLISSFFLTLVSCKTNKNGENQFTLTVNLSTGVDGSPAGGSYSYDKDQIINYSYSLKAGYGDLQVKLDGQTVNATGTFTMNSNHILSISATAGTQYTLTVDVGSGVSGTPVTGSSQYAEGDTVSYNYSLESGDYKNLKVLLDGVEVSPSGTVTMNSDHSLVATADVNQATYDVRGSWEGFMKDANGDKDYFYITFSGVDELSGQTSGYVVDPTSIGAGTFDVSGDTVVFTLKYGTGNRFFAITGTFSDADNMSGNWVWTNHNGDKFYGTFELKKQ